MEQFPFNLDETNNYIQDGGRDVRGYSESRPRKVQKTDFLDEELQFDLTSYPFSISEDFGGPYGSSEFSLLPPIDLDKKKLEDENDSTWNTRFQVLFDSLHSSVDVERDSIKEKLQNLAIEFSQAVCESAKIIVDEFYCPYESKTIKPQDNIGGTIGGTKYVTNGILLKLSCPLTNDLKHCELHIKISSHELKSLENIIGCQISQLHFPLLAVVDYMGFRVVGVSSLPIDNHTIVSGSSNGGVDGHIPEEAEKQKLIQMCNKLNLLPHEVKSPKKVPPSRFEVFGPFDLEGHIGKDKRFYLLDFSRLFPPDLIRCALSNPINELADQTIVTEYSESSHLFNLFRAELVKSFPEPLCSDTFSNVLENQQPEFEKVIAAHKHLIERMNSLVQDQKNTVNFSEFFTPENLIQYVHSNGINVRYFGYLHQLFVQQINEHSYNVHQWIRFLLIEMVARVIKWQLRSLLRKSIHLPIKPLSIIVTELNSMFSTSGRSALVERVRTGMILRFYYLPIGVRIITANELYEYFFKDPNSGDLIMSLMNRVFDLIGVSIKSRVFSVDGRLVEGDFEESVQPIVKHLNLMQLL